MSLKKVVALIMVGTVLLMVALSAAVLLPVSKSFSRIEQDEAREDNERALQSIEAELTNMLRTAKDWGHWDETFAFVAGERPSYPDDNLTFDAIRTLDMDLLLIYGGNAHLVGGRIYDLPGAEQVQLRSFAPGVLQPDDPLLASLSPDGGVKGLVMTERGPMLVVATPITPTDTTAGSNGSFILGRILDEDRLAAIRRQTGVYFELEPVAPDDGAALEPDWPGHLATRTALKDIYGRPAVQLISYTPRNIAAVGDTSIHLSLLSLVLIGAVNIGLMWLLLQRLVVRRLRRVTEHMALIAHSGLVDKRIPPAGEDELGIMAREFNRMLDRLAEARKQLIEQSHQSGMAEMAAGVLHNLRNGLSPLVGRLEALTDKLRKAPGAELGRAIAELADPQTPDDRRRRLVDYAGAVSSAQAALREEVAAELAASDGLARKLGDILKHQDKFIYGRSVLEPIDLQDAIADAINLLSPRIQRSIAITVAPAMAQLPPATAERIALVQILHNLLVNAAEAIDCAGRPDGRISVTAVSDGGMLRVRVADNGIGIDAACLGRLFERGYTTKGEGAGGLGLHWCATAAANMQGQIQAASDGLGHGAAFDLVLPAAAVRDAA